LKHLTSIRELTRDSALSLLADARALRSVNERELKKLPTLRGKTVVNLFVENSTRTRISFEIAAKRLSADVINFDAATSSISKGESLKDTAQTLEALGAAAVVIRHPRAGAASNLAYRGWLAGSVINAGDGAHEHPTQALLDALTISDAFSASLGGGAGLDGLRVLIVGDIAHSRVARSNVLLLNLLGAQVTVAGPTELVPRGFESFGASVVSDFDEALAAGPDVVMMLRVQRERLASELDASEYIRKWSLSTERASALSAKTQVLHPGPMNRGFEIASAVADGPRSRVLDQVRNGLAVRMAVLNRCLSGQEIQS
jgi:aspartate carbamoyltransferase catalytic subunit